MKRLLFSMALSLSVVLSWAQFSGSGAGTESDPYRIYNADQLEVVCMKILHVVNISFVIPYFLGKQLNWFSEKGNKEYMEKYLGSMPLTTIPEEEGVTDIAED